MAKEVTSKKLADILKEELECEKCEPLGSVSGGCISEGQSFDTDNGKIFVKVNTKSEARKMFEGEFQSLKEIFRTDTLQVPKPLKVLPHPSGSGAVFVTEHLEMKNLRKYQSQLGTSLARLHLDNINKLEKETLEESKIGESHNLTTVKKFGFPCTTCCGYNGQNNEWHDDWVTFYTRSRLQCQMDLIDKQYGDAETTSLWSRLKLKIPEFFRGLDIKPSLLHGDLWSGNVAETEDGPVAFDPASFYGHHEFDLAIAGMFGGFSKAFYDAYHKLMPKEKGFEQRHQLYLLFHHLNHWNHFGTTYKSSSLSIMRGLLGNS